jgi:hypothetical protein
MPGKIPGGITVQNFVKIRGFLEQILKELETAGAKRVVTRLNSSDSIKPVSLLCRHSGGQRVGEETNCVE